MKKFTKMMVIAALAAIVAAGMSAEALAVGTDQENQAAVEAAAPETGAQEDTASSDSAAISSELQDALKAYNSAREEAQQEDLKADLDSYVAAGKITQEQADLILNAYKEKEALQNGVCPNCGYEFQYTHGGKGGRGIKKGGDLSGGGSSSRNDSSSGGRGMRSGKGKARG